MWNFDCIQLSSHLFPFLQLIQLFLYRIDLWLFLGPVPLGGFPVLTLLPLRITAFPQIRGKRGFGVLFIWSIGCTFCVSWCRNGSRSLAWTPLPFLRRPRWVPGSLLLRRWSGLCSCWFWHSWGICRSCHFAFHSISYTFWTTRAFSKKSLSEHYSTKVTIETKIATELLRWVNTVK